MSRVRLLPLLIAVAFLTLALRVSEVVTGARDLSGAAVAEEKAAIEPAAADASATVADKKAEGEKPAESVVGDAPADHKDQSEAAKANGDKKPATKDEKPASEWPDPSEMDPDLAKVRAELNKNLAARRATLDQREKELATREAVLKVTESEMDQKGKELTELRQQLRDLLQQQSDEERLRMKSLVKIYEGMKAEDAARIFNTLDITILLEVLTQMSERKSAPILAKMDADRARTITLLMAQQKKLPELPTLAPLPPPGP
jgi:flagellar motility protein MotE (MotC chaperone)